VEVLSKDDDKFHVKYADGNEAHLTYEEINKLLNKEKMNTTSGHSKRYSTTE